MAKMSMKNNNGDLGTNRNRWVALIGRRDEPTDALRDYCSFLRRGLERRGTQLDQVEVLWNADGSFRAFGRLWTESASWIGRWVLIQYTALAWSRRGFPFRILPILWITKFRGARSAMVFHDPTAYVGNRAVDRFRRRLQLWAMKQSYHLAHRSIFTVPIENIEWLPTNPDKASFIPIGANVPVSETPLGRGRDSDCVARTVAVFGVTGGNALPREVRDIAYAVRYASRNGKQLKLSVLGRNSIEAESRMRQELQGTPVIAEFLGVISAQEVVDQLSTSDALLFVRGAVSGSRSSALAGVACGLPIVGYRGAETTFPITKAGLELVAKGDLDALAEALNRVLSDDTLRQNLCRMSSDAQTKYFSWDKIAERFQAELGDD
jgi:glycosyltransferase involved in cell wall biosynthesis